MMIIKGLKDLNGGNSLQMTFKEFTPRMLLFLKYFRLNRKWKLEEHPPFTPTYMNLNNYDFPSRFQRIFTDQAIEWTHNV
jgi:hypothetical protein